MYVVVQRVMSLKTGEMGINAFLHLHPGASWQVPPEDVDVKKPGQFERKSIGVEPNGNRIQSNLEVVAPDDIDLAELEKHLMTFLRDTQSEPLPREGVAGPCRFRLHMLPALARGESLARGQWAREARTLAGAGAKLMREAREARGPRSP